MSLVHLLEHFQIFSFLGIYKFDLEYVKYDELKYV